MDFGIYIHTQGPSSFREVSKVLSRSIEAGLCSVSLSEIDGVFISFSSTSRFSTGIRRLRRRVRRDYKLKLITGGSVPYNCLVEIEAEVADAELIDAASSESALFEFVQEAVVTSLRWALVGFPEEELALLLTQVSDAALPNHRGSD